LSVSPQRIEATIFALLESRSPGATICPSESEGWTLRALEAARAASRRAIEAATLPAAFVDTCQRA
jgi:hypothetical protein